MTSFSRLSYTVIYAGLVLGALITLVPFLLGLLTSFTSEHQFVTGTPLQLPRPPTVANYTNLGGAGFGRAVAVTALMTAVILVGQLTFSVLAAYAFGRLEFPGRDALFWVYLATMMVPGTVTVVPLYLMMAQAGLRNTFWALVLPFMFGSPYAIFLLREHFRIIPNDLVNAARKVVFSRTLPAAEWANTTIARGDTAVEIDKLRQDGDGHIIVSGGISFWRSLGRLDLIDEYRLTLVPYLAGDGARLFEDVGKARSLDLLSSTAFSSGLQLEYRRRR